MQFDQVVLLADPLLQAAAGGFENLVGFFQKDFYQLRVTLRLRGRRSGGRVLNRNGRGAAGVFGKVGSGFVSLGFTVEGGAGVRRVADLAVAAQEGLDGADQFRGVFRGSAAAQGVDHFGEPVVATVQQGKQGRVRLLLAVMMRFVEIFQFVGQIAHRGHGGHAGPSLEGVKVPLQTIHVAGISLFPLVQGMAGGFQNLFGLFQEQADQFRIHVGLIFTTAGPAVGIRGAIHSLGIRAAVREGIVPVW